MKSVAFPVPEIIGGTQKYGQSLEWPGYANASFSPKIFMGWTLLLLRPNLKFVALPVPEIIAIGVSGGVRAPNLREGEAV